MKSGEISRASAGPGEQVAGECSGEGSSPLHSDECRTEQLFSFDEAAEIYRIPVFAFRRAAKAGRFPVYKLGGRARVRLSEVNRAIEQSKIGGKK